jgi:peptide/nickel transport system substrate-binding protein
MNKSKRNVRFGRTFLYLAVVAALCASLVPATARQAAAQGSSRRINNFTVAGRFLEVWSSRGSEQNNVYVNGLPITERRSEISVSDGKSYETQWFERARYEAHPENKPPYDVLLGRLGATLTEGRGSIDPATKRVRNPVDAPFVGIDKPADVNGTTKVWFQETRHSVSGKILEYWNRYGGLQQFGFPLSEQFQEVSAADGKTYTVQYFERNRFELHPEKAAPYEVELGLLGVQQYKTTPIAADQLPTAPPKGVTSARDTMVFAMSQEPASLFYLFETAAVAQIASDPIFDGVIARDARDNLYPEAAWYVPTLENGGAFWVGAGDDRHLVVKYKLRRGLKWADGQEIDSNDVVYAYKLIMDPNSTIQDRTLFEKLYNIDNPDKYTIVCNFMSYNQARDFYNGTSDKDHFAFLKQFVDEKRAVVDPLYNTVGSNVLPEHILGRIPADKITESSYARNPVGNGPYKVERWDAGSQIVLVPNPNYNLTAAPLLKRIVIKVIADTNQIIAQLKTGDLDGATYDAFTAPTQVLDTLADSGQTVEYVPARTWEHIDFNLDRPYFKDKAVRQAMIHAINRQRIVDQVALGKFQILHTFLPPASWASLQNPDFAKEWAGKYPMKQYNYDVNRANQLLDQAGWVRGSDGIRAKGGVKLSFDYATVAGNKTREQITQLVANDLKQVGIDAKLKYVPSDYYFADDGYLSRREHDLGQYAWTLDVDPGGQLYDSQLIPSEGNNYSGGNYPGFRNARFDELSRAAANEIDRNARAPLFAEMQSIWTEELPAIPIYVRSKIEVHKNNLVNWEVSGGIVYVTYKVAAMYFK